MTLLLGGTCGRASTSTWCTRISDKADSQSTSSNQSHSTSNLLILSTEALQLRIDTSNLASQRTIKHTSLLLQLSIQLLNLLVDRSNKVLQTRNIHLGSQTNRNQEQQRDTNTQTGVDATLGQVRRQVRGTRSIGRSTRLLNLNDYTIDLVAVLVLNNNNDIVARLSELN